MLSYLQVSLGYICICVSSYMSLKGLEVRDASNNDHTWDLNFGI